MAAQGKRGSDLQLYVIVVFGYGLFGMFLTYPWGALIGVVLASILCYGLARVIKNKVISGGPVETSKEIFERTVKDIVQNPPSIDEFLAIVAEVRKREEAAQVSDEIVANLDEPNTRLRKAAKELRRLADIYLVEGDCVILRSTIPPKRNG